MMSWVAWTFVAIGLLTCIIVGLIAWVAQAPPLEAGGAAISWTFCERVWRGKELVTQEYR
jgi:hypothetical protein